MGVLKRNNIFLLFISAIAFLLFLNFIRSNVFYSNFNLDEVILFFTARGIDYNTAAFGMEKWGLFSETIFLNRNGGSMDPGAFTLLLRFWSMISSSTLWLRLLPMSLFCLGGLFLYLGARNITENKKHALLPLFLLFTSELILEHSFTIRPYSMESAGYFFFFYLLTLDKIFKPNLGQNITILALLIFFLGSRYTLWVGYGVFLISHFGVNKRVPRKEVLYLVFLPTLYLLGIYLFSLRFQLEQLPLIYAKDFFLKEIGLLHTLKNFSIPIFWMLISLPFFLVINRKSINLVTSHKKIAIMAFGLLLAFVFLDLVGISPFHLTERYTIGIHSFGICSFTCLLLRALANLSGDLSKYSKVALMIILVQFARTSMVYEFNQKSDLTPILKLVKSKEKVIDSLYCDPITFSMLVFLKDFNHYQMNWDELPNFVKIKDLRDTEAKYFFVTSVINGVKSADTKIQKMKSFDPLYKGWYQKLYKRNGSSNE